MGEAAAKVGRRAGATQGWETAAQATMRQKCKRLPDFGDCRLANGNLDQNIQSGAYLTAIGQLRTLGRINAGEDGLPL